MEGFSVELPLSLELGVKKKKRYYLNLNIYRNLAFHLNNNLKKEFKRLVAPMLPEVHYERYTITYVLYLPNFLKRDISNVCSVVDKFFCDALVELGIVPDDNYEHLPLVTYKFGDVLPKDGKVIAHVTKVD